jgi:hypothetical protein
MPFKIPTIEIKIRTNVPGETQFTALTNTMFYHAPGSTTFATSTTNNPYFRVDVAFNQDMLDGTTPYDFFFNKKAFVAGVGAATEVDVKDRKKVQKTAKENVIFMLKSLFTTSYPIEDNLENSYDANIQQTSSQTGGRKSFIPDFLAKWFSFSSSPAKFSYISLGTSKYTVLGVMWINDVVNHSRYRQLFKDVIAYKVKKTKKLILIEKKLNELASQFTNEKLTEWMTFMNTKKTSTTTPEEDVGVKPIQIWLDSVNLEQREFKTAWEKGLKNGQQDKAALLTKYLAPYLNNFYIQQLIITELVASRRPRVDSKRLTEFQNDPNFRDLVELSREYYTQSHLKSFFSGNEEQPKLFAPVYTKNVTALTEFQSSLSQDTDFIDMMSKVLEVVPDNTLELPKNATFEFNPILKKLQVSKTSTTTGLLSTTNSNLQEVIEQYLKNGCSNEAFETFAEQLRTEYFDDEGEDTEDKKKKKSIMTNTAWMTSDVVQQTKDLFAIEVQLELMQGLLDEKIIEQISCAFVDKRLQTEYDRLKNKLDKIPLYLQKPRMLFSIETFLKPPPTEKTKEEVKKTGGRGRTHRRRLRRRPRDTRRR